MIPTDRLRRLLRLARLRDDRVAIATVETALRRLELPKPERWGAPAMTETEMRALWGDR